MKKACLFITIIIVTLFVGTHTKVQARLVCNPTDFYEYGSNHETYGEQVEWQHTKTNPTDFPESVEFSVARTAYANISTGVTQEADAVLYKVGISLEVEWGVSETRTEAIGFVIPPNSTRTMYFGHEYVITYGNAKHYDKWCNIISSNNVNGRWSYESFSG